VLAAASDAGTWMIGKYDAVNPPALKRLLGGGTQLRGFSQEIIYAETLAQKPRFKKIYDSLVAFRSDSYLWWQVAEMSFDSFQIRMRTRT
jgi:TRAP-type mannitol/chloroaromatic compound transport system substrate-binding protein